MEPTGVLFCEDNSSNHTWFFYASFIAGCFGVFLNLVTLATLLDERLRFQTHYHLTISLALVDLASSASSIYYAHFPSWENYQDNLLDRLLCRVVFSRYIYFTLCAVSAWHVVMISVERYLFVVHHDWYSANFTLKHSLVQVFLCWLICSVVLLDVLLPFEVRDSSCILRYRSQFASQMSAVEEGLFMLVIPTTIMVVFYYKLYAGFREVWVIQHATGVQRIPLSSIHHPCSYLFGMLLLIAVYVLAWGPNEIIWTLYGFKILDDSIFEKWPFCLSQLAMIINAVLNPLLYACSYTEFRNILVQKLLTPFRCMMRLCDSGNQNNYGNLDTDI